ncbi:hypothetical protein BK138_15985 [Paenibacillus rhizosphaerae]|uniref:HTH cro/C1-type domain-containing protein n=1 Tax=Paenibacillus rhizosphaerae TaxID=297318 RepID=A0A1R1ES99_9BACL|nr:hypothetical protein BK138_15985 [Paenibacillus rhizosphaerae]
MHYKLGKCLLLSLINRKGWTQAEFARRMGVTRQFVNDLISGKAKMSFEFAINAAHLLDCSTSDLYELKIERNRKE